MVTIVLRGAARIEAHGAAHWLEPGALSVVDHKGAIVMRQSRARERYESLVLEWDPGSIGGEPPAGFTIRALSEDTLGVVAAAADELARTTSIDRAERALRTVLGTLRALPLDPGAALVEPVPERTSALSTALDELLSDLAQRPMAIDLHEQLGLSLRQLNRVVTDFNERYGFNAGSWRDARGRRRVLMGVALMSARGATVEEVAEAVGYASPTAFARALAEAELPPPGEIARIVDCL